MTREATIRRYYLVALIGLLLITLARFAVATMPSVVFPYGLDYGEGIVWKQMDAIIHGQGYPPVHGFPAIVFHYPPLYHLVTAAAALVAPSPLLAGRLVSFAAAIATLVLVFLLTGRLADARMPPLARHASALTAAAIVSSTEALRFWAPTMRVDLLACALELAGLWCATAVRGRPVHVAAVLFVAAFFTKQNEVAGPVAVFGVLLLTRPGLAVRGMALGVGLSLALAAVLLAATHGRAVDHLILYNINRFAVADLVWKFRYFVRPDVPAVLAGLVGALLATVWLVGAWRRSTAWRGFVAADRVVVHAIMLAFVGIKTLTLVGLGKSGSADSYLIEWYAAVGVYGGYLVAVILARAFAADVAGRGLAATALLVLPLLVAADGAVRRHTRGLPDLAIVRRDALAQRDILHGVNGPVISEDMVTLLQTGRPVLWEPAIFQELAEMKRYDQRPVINAIRRGQVAAVVSGTSLDRFTPAVAAAIRAALPVERHAGSWVVHLPKTSTAS